MLIRPAIIESALEPLITLSLSWYELSARVAQPFLPEFARLWLFPQRFPIAYKPEIALVIRETLTRSSRVNASRNPVRECWNLALVDISVRKCKRCLVPTLSYVLDLLSLWDIPICVNISARRSRLSALSPLCIIAQKLRSSRSALLHSSCS